MSKLRVRVGGEWIEVDSDDVEIVHDVSADYDGLGEIVDATPVLEPIVTPESARREKLRSEAAWIDG